MLQDFRKKKINKYINECAQNATFVNILIQLEEKEQTRSERQRKFTFLHAIKDNIFFPLQKK